MSVGKHFTSTVSVAMVLLILGIVGCAAFAAGNLARHIRENLGFDIVMKMDVDMTQINAMKQRLTSSGFVSSYDYLSPEQILEQENHYLDTDIADLLGFNPYQPEFNVKVKAEYATVDSIDRIVAPLRALDPVDEITVHTDTVKAVNTNIGSISGSFWFDNFIDWLQRHVTRKSGMARFSIGALEGGSHGNPRFANVQEQTREVVDILVKAGIDATFTTNPGDYFAPIAPRIDSMLSLLFPNAGK